MSQGLVPCYFTSELMAKRHSLSCRYKCDWVKSESYQYQQCHLRQRTHNKALIPKTTYLSDRDYIISYILAYCYTLLR